MWIHRGTPLGQLVNDEAFYFTSVVSQQDISQVFTNEIRSSEVRLAGQAAERIPVLDITKIPVEQTELPSAALGYVAGGEIAIDIEDASGMVAAEPFYEVRLGISKGTEAVLYHGRSGRVKFKLPPEPLLWQLNRALRQLLQERYQF